MELKLDELAVRCEECAAKNVPGIGPPIMNVPGVEPNMSAEVCSKCGGSGWILSPAGMVLKQFMDIAKRTEV